MSLKKWANYLFHRDFTPYKEILQEIKLGVVSEEDANILIEMLKDIDKGEGKLLWNYEEGQEWSLVGAEVTYNGQNRTSFSTKGSMKNALFLKFPEDAVKPQYFIYLCWN